MTRGPAIGPANLQEIYLPLTGGNIYQPSFILYLLQLPLHSSVHHHIHHSKASSYLSIHNERLSDHQCSRNGGNLSGQITAGPPNNPNGNCRSSRKKTRNSYSCKSV